jgi:hypothetical protein
MPSSTSFFKKQTIDYIINNFNINIKILDVGAGIGTYSDLLKPKGYKNIDCVEIFENYIQLFDLKSKYNKVINENVVNLDESVLNSYDLIIFGDVIEHITEEDSLKLFSKIKNRTNVIVCVPFMAPQGEHYDNIYETHLQDKLTFNNFLEKYKTFVPFCVRYDYGVFLNVNSLNITQDIYIIDLENTKDVEDYSIDRKIINLNNEIVNVTESQNEDNFPKSDNNEITFVTALWNIKRDQLGETFGRSYETYLEKFSELLKAPINMYIFIDKSDEEFIWKHRSKSNTKVHIMSVDELAEWFPFTNLTDSIRQKPEWLNQAGWLPESTQARLKMYNPLVMSKMFMLNNVTVWNPFESEYFYWIDAGITNTVHWGYFTHDKVQLKLPSISNNFMFLAFPYPDGNEIHGFTRTEMNRFAQTENVEYVCRGGFFGGNKTNINQANALYYNLLETSLKEGFMGTEESIFTLMTYLDEDGYNVFAIDGNGLINTFFEGLKNDNTPFIKNKSNKNIIHNPKVALYVITFNSPKQFKTLLASMESYDKNYLLNTKKVLLNNSTNKETLPEYERLCLEYGFEHIQKDNIGICGGRQFIAEHFDKSDCDYMLFFEDDMFFYPKKELCRNGFNRFDPDLYNKSLHIINKENFDFLKLNFTELYGDNGTQWAWYNVPQNIREQHWPNKKKLPVQGLDPNAPKTVFNCIKTYEGIPYTMGEIYYCNWPQIVSKAGNKKMFINTTWAYPFEQTWMSHMFQLSIKGELNGGILLMTPTEHDRFDFYGSDERREN